MDNVALDQHEEICRHCGEYAYPRCVCSNDAFGVHVELGKHGKVYGDARFANRAAAVAGFEKTAATFARYPGLVVLYEVNHDQVDAVIDRRRLSRDDQ